MFKNLANSPALAVNAALALPARGGLGLGLGPDPMEQMLLADRADSTLLRLVLCVATAVMVLALASSLHV